MTIGVRSTAIPHTYDVYDDHGSVGTIEWRKGETGVLTDHRDGSQHEIDRSENLLELRARLIATFNIEVTP